MNDQIVAKKLLGASVNSALDTTARNFERVASANKNEERRRVSFINSQSPTDLVIAHQPRSAKSTVQRTKVALEQTLARFDSASNLIGTNVIPCTLNIPIETGVSEQEVVDAFSLLVGALAASDYTLLRALYRGEQ